MNQQQTPSLSRREHLRQRLLKLTPAQRATLARQLLPATERGDDSRDLPELEPAPQRLAAWLVAADRVAGVDPEALRSQLAQRLPEYMLPAHLCVREALPRNHHGKLDRDALQLDRLIEPPPMPAAKQHAPRSDTVDAVSARVLEVWREVLGSSRIDADDDFFELGGDSLLAMRVVSRLKRHFDTTLSPTDLFEHSSASALATRLRQLGAGSDATAEIATTAVSTPREQVEI